MKEKLEKRGKKRSRMQLVSYLAGGASRLSEERGLVSRLTGLLT